MRGKQSDVLGTSIQRASLTSSPPVNHIYNPLLSIPGYHIPMGRNVRQEIAARRNVDFRLINEAQPVQTSLIGKNVKKKGLSVLPNSTLFDMVVKSKNA
jgi:hypothetical protein